MRGVLVLLLLVVVLLVSSCQQGTQSTNVGGIDIEFIENQPPVTLREDASFTVGLYLKNNLPKAVQNIEVCVQDSFRDGNGGIFGKECKSVDISAADVSGDTISPEIEQVYFPIGEGGYVYDNLGIGIDSVVVLVDISYFLNTISTVSDFCLKEDPGYEVEEMDCDPNKIFTGSDIRNQIAPIIVDRVKTSVVNEGYQNRVYSEIYFKKAVGGEVLQSDFYSGEDSTMPLVGYSITLASGEVFECDSDEEGFLVFDDLVEVLECNAPVVLSSEWENSAINIELSYNYGIGANREISFKKSGEELI